MRVCHKSVTHPRDNQISDMSPVCGQIIKNMKRRIPCRFIAINFFTSHSAKSPCDDHYGKQQ
mgnify:CR=1 FL=1